MSLIAYITVFFFIVKYINCLHWHGEVFFDYVYM
jgi:hypothetical protein